MSGNLWMVSNMLDDEDSEMIQHDFINYYQGSDYYGLGLKVFTRMAHEAGAVYKIGKMVRIRRDIFEEYLRLVQSKEYDQSKATEEESFIADGSRDRMRQGALTVDPQSGRMDIRFGLEDYYGGLQCGKSLEVLIDGNWVPTRIEMGNGWYLVGIQTADIAGLIVRI